MTPPPLPLPGRGPLHPAIWLDRLGEVSTGMLLQAQWEDGLPFLRSAEVAGAVPDLLPLVPPGGVLRLDQQDRHERTLVAALSGAVVRLSVAHRLTTIDVVGSDRGATDELLDRLVAEAERVTMAPEGQVAMNFWSFRDGAGERGSRRITAPTWADVAGNYARRTQESLASLVSLTDLSGRAGRLVLWHGLPGTGKTTAVRALSREWGDWCC